MPLTYPALKTELQADPATIGYAALVASGNDVGLAALLNEVRAGISIRRPDIAPAEILEAIDARDFEPTPNVLAVAWFGSLTRQERVRLLNDDGSQTRVLANLRRLLLALDTNGSRARLQDMANRPGSRAEQLFGAGVVVTHQDVAIALRQT